MRQQLGKAVYVVGGPGLLDSLIDAGLLDELHLIVHPNDHNVQIVELGGPGARVMGERLARRA